MWPAMAAVQAPLFGGRDLPKYCSYDREAKAQQRCGCCPLRGYCNELDGRPRSLPSETPISLAILSSLVLRVEQDRSGEGH